MPRKNSPTLTEAELRIMNVVWRLGSATVAVVAEELKAEGAPSYSTVLTIMRILERKGYLRHRVEGRAFVYKPKVDQQQAQRDTVRYIVDRFFGGSAGSLALNILESEDLDEEELARLRKLLEEDS